MTAADREAGRIAAFIEEHGYTVENALNVYAERMREVAVLAVPRVAGAFIDAAEKAEAAATAWRAIYDPDDPEEEVPA